MASISAVSSGISSAAMRPQGAGGRGTDPIEPVARVLRMSADEVRTELQGGASLAGLATQRGVSHDDLVAAIKEGMPDSAASSANATVRAERIASRRGGPARPAGPPPGPPPAGPPPAASQDSDDSSSVLDSLSSTQLEQLSSLLKLSQDEMKSKIKDIGSLLTTADGSGVSLKSLASVLTTGSLVDKRL